jgi:two-component system sensor kinase FixL
MAASNAMSTSQFQPDLEAHPILAAIMESSDDAIIATDLGGTILTWNRGAERIFGYAASEVVGRSLAVLMPPNDDSELAGILKRLNDGRPIEPHDTLRMTKGGYRVNVAVTAMPVRANDGRPIGAVTIARDIAVQRRAEQAMRRSEARWRAIIESAVDAIIMINRHGGIESFNPAAERMFGYRSEELIGRNVTVLMPEPYASEHDHYLRRYQMTGERRIIGIGREVTARRKDGTVFPAHLSVGELELDGEVKFTGIVRDQTDRMSLEVKLRDEAGLVRIGELAAVLAHEVKNPLAAVSGAIQMLSEHLASEEDQEIVHEVLRRLDGLGSLMTDLLLYARPPRPRMTEVNLTEMLHALVSFLGADPAWQEVIVDIHGQNGSVTGDPELLKVVFQNLLLNAAQAMNGQGFIQIRLQDASGSVLVDVVDTGPGIPAEAREKLFTPFFTTKVRGTGLGLATVRRIVEAHAGHVEILSSGRDGTTIRVTLPSAARLA